MWNERRPTQTALALLILAVASSACQVTGSEPAGAAAVATPVPSPKITVTPTPTSSPAPTSTPTPTLAPTIDFAATERAREAAEEEQALEEIHEVLDRIGIRPDSGSLAWRASSPIVIPMTDYHSTIYHSIGGGQEFSNFVLYYRVTWKSSSGLAGCGSILRSEADLSLGEQFRFNTLRLSGLPAWFVQLVDNGRLVSTVSGNAKFSDAISMEDNSTNEFILVLDGSVLTIYANGTRLGQVTILRRSSGFNGVFGWQESGTSSCTFDGAWIWALE